MKRYLALAAAAAAMLAGVAAGVWFTLVRGVADSLQTQAQLAETLLASGAALDAAVARSLVRPGVRVVLIDPQADSLIDASSAAVRSLPVPPSELPRAGPPLGQGPPGQGPPGQGPPGQGPPGRGLLEPGAPVSARTPPIDALALSLAQLRPVHIDGGGRRADLFPDGAMLGRWLAIDGAALGLGLLAIGGSAAFVSASRARAERAGLQAALEKRDAEAARYRRFLAETGHELRTPLTVMSGYVDIMRSSASGGALDARIVEGMYAETARMRVLVEKMLTLARLDSDAAVPRLIDLAAAAEEAAETARRRFPSAHISLRASADARVVIDADDYAAALGNLIENAVKYAPSSPIAIETGIANGMTFTRVTDRGPGIPAGQRDAIFERFFRGDERSGSQGSGLGLAIVKRVSERWNGSVELRSDGGETAFTLLFPQADEELHAAVR